MIQLSKDVIVVSTSGDPENKRFLGKTGRAEWNPNQISKRKFPFLVTFTDKTLGMEMFRASEIENL
jgi:hypothetical protein